MSSSHALLNVGDFFEPLFNEALELEDSVIVPIKALSTTSSGESAETEVLSHLISINEAEETGNFTVSELEDENVNQLQVKNLTGNYVFIPAFYIIEGGRQDRTIAKPVIVPPMSAEDDPIVIPVFCVERGRWRYDNLRSHSRRRFRSSRSRLSPSLTRIALESPRQDVLWDSIEYYSHARGLARHEAPSRSFYLMKEKMRESRSDYGELSSQLERYLAKKEESIGIALFMSGSLRYLEAFGSLRVWQQSIPDLSDMIADEITLLRDLDFPFRSMSTRETQEAWRRWLAATSTVKKFMRLEQVKMRSFSYHVGHGFTPNHEWSLNATFISSTQLIHLIALQETPLAKRSQPRRKSRPF